MQLVEVVPHARTSARALAMAGELVRRMGKIPVVVGACPGFLVNRVLLPYMMESAAMLDEGVDPERIDRALKRFGMPMGPLALADEVGIDVGTKVAHNFEAAYGERMRVPSSLDRLAGDAGTLGKKTGRGFFVYDNGSVRVNPRLGELLGSRGEPVELGESEIVDRAVLAMVNESARCLGEEVAASAEALDAAVVNGTGFAPFRGGPMRYAEDRGVREVVERLRELEARYGSRFAPAPLLEAVAGNGGRFGAHLGKKPRRNGESNGNGRVAGNGSGAATARADTRGSDEG